VTGLHSNRDRLKRERSKETLFHRTATRDETRQAVESVVAGICANFRVLFASLYLFLSALFYLIPPGQLLLNHPVDHSSMASLVP